MKRFLSSIISILLIATIVFTSYASAEDDNIIASYLNVYDVEDVGKKNAVPIYDLSKSYSINSCGFFGFSFLKNPFLIGVIL